MSNAPESGQAREPIAGVDGCPAGWLRLAQSARGEAVEPRVFASGAELLADAARFAVIAIDIPIGLPEAAARACDVEARRDIQPRGASVFPAPVRATLGATTYEDACARSRAASGRALSRQAFAILPKIREIDALLRGDPALRARVREVHPELCFRHWIGAPLDEPKKTGLGFTMRLAPVERAFAGQFASVRRAVPRRAATDDDILDAFAALWTARRILDGSAITLPANPPLDAAGLRMEMLA